MPTDDTRPLARRPAPAEATRPTTTARRPGGSTPAPERASADEYPTARGATPEPQVMEASIPAGGHVERPVFGGNKQVFPLEGLPAGFEAREGDTLVVSWPEVSLPTAVQYLNVKVGGLIYTRKLLDGDDVGKEFATVYNALNYYALTSATAKLAAFTPKVKKGGEGA